MHELSLDEVAMVSGGGSEIGARVAGAFFDFMGSVDWTSSELDVEAEMITAS